jgi:hypothetical protein
VKLSSSIFFVLMSWLQLSTTKASQLEIVERIWHRKLASKLDDYSLMKRIGPLLMIPCL